MDGDDLESGHWLRADQPRLRALLRAHVRGALARLVGDRELAAHSLLLRGMVLCHQPRLREGLAALERGVAEAMELPGDGGRDGGLLALARLAAWLPASTPLPPAPADAPPAALAQRGTLANWYGWLGDYRRARATGEANRAAVRELGVYMGYPECCVTAFTGMDDRGDNLANERAPFLRSPGAPLHPLLHRTGAVRLPISPW